MIEKTGKITRILYRNDDFLIAILKTKEGEDIKIIGNIYGVDKNEQITIKGGWETHPKFGRQLMVESWERPIPQTEEQVLAFLSSPMVKGCGKKTARNIVNKLGKNALEIITKEKESCLSNIKGLGKSRSKQIVQSVVGTFELQKIISQLLVYGITAPMAIKAYKEYGSNTAEVIMKNPYELTNLNLVGFQKADEIARRIGIMPTSGYRIEACLKYVLKKMCFEKGHTYILKKDLLHETNLALNHNANPSEIVSDVELEDCLFCSEEKFVVIEDDCIYPTFLFKHEQALAGKLSKMMGSRLGRGVPNFKKHIRKYQKKHGIVLAEKQRYAIQRLFEKNLLVLTGGPGTGKTTVIRIMVDIYRKMYPEHTIRLVAPTGRASRKLSEVTGLEASTIHRLIGYQKGKQPLYNKDNRLPCNLLIIDEMSMVDVILANNLMQALSNDTKVLFVGDTDQLPSVAPGNVLRDLINSGIPTVTLTEVFRQAQESQIINNAHKVNRGKSLFIDQEKDDFFFISQENPEKIAKLIVKSALRFIELGYSISDILVLSPMKNGVVGTIALNEMLRNKLNPSQPDKKEWKVGQKLYRRGDKVIQMKNNYDKDVFNGDLGIVVDITKEKNNNGKWMDILKVNYTGKVVTYTKDDLKELDLAYSITIHKSQGGEAPIVIMPITTSHYIMLARNLIYTGMTRAKEKLVFIGTHKAIDIAIKNNKITKRNSSLAKKVIYNISSQQNRRVRIEH